MTPDLMKEESRQEVDEVLDTLPFREREIVKLRLGLWDGEVYSLEEVGRIFKVTRERIRQLEARAFRKLQHPIRSKLIAAALNEHSESEDLT